MPEAGEETRRMFEQIGWTHRDDAIAVFENFDFDSQLRAIKRVLETHADQEKDDSEQIDHITNIAKNSNGYDSLAAESEWVELLHNSIYDDAARSIATAAMLVPFLESLFKKAFHGIRKLDSEHSSKLCPTQNRFLGKSKKFWDCCLYDDKEKKKPQKNITEGIRQLATEIGLAHYLPNDLYLCMQALYKYRNAVFHNGYEWPNEEKLRFAKQIRSLPAEKHDWFTCSTIDGDPWIYYINDTLISTSLEITEDSISGIGKYIKEKILS